METMTYKETIKEEWDNKFGLIKRGTCSFSYGGECYYNMPDSKTNCMYKGDEGRCPCYVEREEPEREETKLEGVGKDAPIETNTAGGKQSKSPYAMYLIDPEFLQKLFIGRPYYKLIAAITDFMMFEDKSYLFTALLATYKEDNPTENKIAKVVLDIAKVLKEGADKYKPNNWRLIPQEEHINHALVHLMAHIAGDKQDDHLEHCKCRLMMAFATKPSEGFSYTCYLHKTS